MIAFSGRVGQESWRRWRWGILAFIVVVAASSAGAIVAATNAGPISAPFMAEPRTEVQYVVPTETARPSPTPEPTYQPAGPSRSYPATYEEPLAISRGPRAAQTSNVHVGPHWDYVVLGTMAKGARVDVVGRDESGDWLAINFPQNSSFRAWVEAVKVDGVRDIESLEVIPVRLLP